MGGNPVANTSRPDAQDLMAAIGRQIAQRGDTMGVIPPRAPKRTQAPTTLIGGDAFSARQEALGTLLRFRTAPGVSPDQPAAPVDVPTPAREASPVPDIVPTVTVEEADTPEAPPVSTPVPVAPPPPPTARVVTPRPISTVVSRIPRDPITPSPVAVADTAVLPTVRADDTRLDNARRSALDAALEFGHTVGVDWDPDTAPPTIAIEGNASLASRIAMLRNATSASDIGPVTASHAVAPPDIVEVPVEQPEAWSPGGRSFTRLFAIAALAVIGTAVAAGVCFFAAPVVVPFLAVGGAILGVIVLAMGIAKIGHFLSEWWSARQEERPRPDFTLGTLERQGTLAAVRS